MERFVGDDDRASGSLLLVTDGGIEIDEDHRPARRRPAYAGPGAPAPEAGRARAAPLFGVEPLHRLLDDAVLGFGDAVLARQLAHTPDGRVAEVVGALSLHCAPQATASRRDRQ